MARCCGGNGQGGVKQKLVPRGRGRWEWRGGTGVQLQALERERCVVPCRRERCRRIWDHVMDVSEEKEGGAFDCCKNNLERHEEGRWWGG